MKILLLGATGTFGSALLPALLAHKHTVIVYVRNPTKLRSLITPTLLSSITAIESGDATDTAAIRAAILKHKCTGVLNSAGQAAILPWQAPQMQEIEKAVTNACIEASKELGWKLRVWYLGGAGLLDVPGLGEGKEKMMCKYIPLFWEHRLTYELLLTTPGVAEHISYSILCPGQMYPLTTPPAKGTPPPLIDLHPSNNPLGNDLLASVDTLPGYSAPYGASIPFLGPYLGIMWNASRTKVSLQSAADFLAGGFDDAEGGQREASKWVGKRVGIVEGIVEKGRV